MVSEVRFRFHGYGPKLLVTSGGLSHEVFCSSVFDPFPDLMKWLEEIATGERVATVVIDEEGEFTRLTLHSRMDGRYQLLVAREWESGRGHTPRRKSKCNLDLFVNPWQTVGALYDAFTLSDWPSEDGTDEVTAPTVRQEILEELGEFAPADCGTAEWLVRLPGRVAVNLLATTGRWWAGPKALLAIAAAPAGTKPPDGDDWPSAAARYIAPGYASWPLATRIAFIETWLDEPNTWPGPTERRMRSQIVEDWLEDRAW